MGKRQAQGLFIVDGESFSVAIDLGYRTAVVYLVICCGSERTNEYSSWSCKAAETYMRVHRRAAQQEIDTLISHGLLKMEKTGRRPRYQIVQMGGEQIPLPASLILPLAGEMPPLQRLKETEDGELLKLYIYLFSMRAVEIDLSIGAAGTKFSKRVHRNDGNTVYLGFDRETPFIDPSHPIFSKGIIDPEKIERQIHSLHLEHGLITKSYCLFSGDSVSSDFLFPVTGPTEEEEAIYNRMKSTRWAHECGEFNYFVPMLRHLKNAQLRGVYQLRHRPKTKPWNERRRYYDEAIQRAHSDLDLILRNGH
jgi:hypothetical protein